MMAVPGTASMFWYVQQNYYIDDLQPITHMAISSGNYDQETAYQIWNWGEADLPDWINSDALFMVWSNANYDQESNDLYDYSIWYKIAGSDDDFVEYNDELNLAAPTATPGILGGIAPGVFTDSDFLDEKVWWQIRALDNAPDGSTLTPLRTVSELEALYQPFYHPPTIGSISLENNYEGEIDIVIDAGTQEQDEGRSITQDKEYTCHVVAEGVPDFLLTPWQSSTTFNSVVTSPIGNTPQLAQVLSRWSSTSPEDLSTLTPSLHQDIEKLVNIKNTEFVTAVRQDQITITNSVSSESSLNYINVNIANGGLDVNDTNEFDSVMFGLRIESEDWNDFYDNDSDGVAQITEYVDNTVGNQSFGIQLRATTSDSGTTHILNSYSYYTHAEPLSLIEGDLTNNSVTYSITNENANFPKYYIRYVTLDRVTGTYPAFGEVPPIENFLDDQPTTVTIEVDGTCSDHAILNEAECDAASEDWIVVQFPWGNFYKNIKVQVIVCNVSGILQPVMPEYTVTLLPEDMNSGNISYNNISSNNHLINVGYNIGSTDGDFISETSQMGMNWNDLPFGFEKFAYDVHIGYFSTEATSSVFRGWSSDDVDDDSFFLSDPNEDGYLEEYVFSLNYGDTAYLSPHLGMPYLIEHWKQFSLQDGTILQSANKYSIIGYNSLSPIREYEGPSENTNINYDLVKMMKSSDGTNLYLSSIYKVHKGFNLNWFNNPIVDANGQVVSVDLNAIGNPSIEFKASSGISTEMNPIVWLNSDDLKRIRY